MKHRASWKTAVLVGAALLFAPSWAGCLASPVDQPSEADVRPPSPSLLERLRWLIGTWHGEGLGGQTEEVWAAPSGGTMMGMFKMLREGAPVFYEFFVVVEEGESLKLRLKHFDPDFVGWEEKGDFVEFPLVRLEEKAVHFDGLVFRLEEPDTLRASVSIAQGDQPAATSEFVFQRIR